MEVSTQSIRDLALELSALEHVDVGEAQRALDERAAKAFMAAHPRRRKQPEQKVIRLWEGYQPLFDEASAELKAKLDYYRDEVKRLKDLIYEAMADGAGYPRAGLVKAQLGPIISSEDYRTQGFGAIDYARGMAEMVANQARFYKIPVSIAQVTPEWATTEARRGRRAPVGGWIPHAEFRVFVEVEHAIIDLLLIQIGPGADLVEQVRLCWARGVNPRVYNPFLPHDFESKHGLDYHGGRHG